MRAINLAKENKHAIPNHGSVHVSSVVWRTNTNTNTNTSSRAQESGQKTTSAEAGPPLTWRLPSQSPGFSLVPDTFNPQPPLRVVVVIDLALLYVNASCSCSNPFLILNNTAVVQLSNLDVLSYSYTAPVYASRSPCSQASMRDMTNRHSRVEGKVTSLRENESSRRWHVTRSYSSAVPH